MPRDANGNYTLPIGNPVVTGTPISSVVQNTTMADVATALTGSLSRTGLGGMLAPLPFTSGTVGAPGITWQNELTSGFYLSSAGDMRAAVTGFNRQRWLPSSPSQLWDGAAWSNIITALTLAPVLSPYAIKAANETITGAWTFAGSGYDFNSQVKFIAGWLSDNYAELGIPAASSTDYGELFFWDYGAAADAKGWVIRFDRSQKNFILASENDAASVSRNLLEFLRGTGQTVTNINYGNSTDQPLHTFYGQVIVETGATPTSLSFNEKTGVVNEHWWTLAAQGTGHLQLFADSDDFSVSNLLFDFDRTGAAVASMSFGNATNNPTYNFLGTGQMTTPYITSTSGGNGGFDALAANVCGIWLNCSNAPADEKDVGFETDSTGQGRLAIFPVNFSANHDILQWDRTGPVLNLINYGNATDLPLHSFLGSRMEINGIEVGYRKIPSVASAGGAAAATEIGKCYSLTGAMSIPANVFVAGDSFSIYNNSAGALALTQGAGLTLRLVGTVATGNRSLAQRGMATLWFVSATEAVITGGGVT